MARPGLRRPLRLALAFAVCGAVFACSSPDDGESLAPQPLKPRTSARTGADEADHDDHDESEGDPSAPPPNDDPELGKARDEGGVTPSGNDCTKGGSYCGGDKVTGDGATLYKCNGPGEPTVIEQCANGCVVNAGVDDACAPAGGGAKVASPVPGKAVTYAFGVKNARYAAGYHTGEDHAAPTGSNAVAVRSGTIRWSNDDGGAYGKWIGLEADNGRTYVYCHLSSRIVASGTKVVAGQLIAKTGATGNVTGPHLHFEDHPVGKFVYGQVRKPAW